ncbi:MAG: hypothetical protein KBD14_01795 [Candidatus Pacebacteria bacterium]|nr:hypothetical protein [Candidatus Paceibacterota bacterium]
MEEDIKKGNSTTKKIFYIFLVVLVFGIILFLINYFKLGGEEYNSKNTASVIDTILNKEEPKYPPLDKEAYDKKILFLANNPVIPTPEPKYDTKTGELIPPKPSKPTIWPKKTVYPKDGAILPFNRIVAYYGNLYSKKMGVLGEYEESVMLEKLANTVKEWELADPSTPVIPAIHYIATVAQGEAGKDGKYRARMPDSEIQKVLKIAEKANAIVFLDIQVGLSNIQNELPYFKKYLELPNVHLGIDPEFSMKTGVRPGKVVGTMDGETDVNFAINYLSQIVKEYNLPPKVLVVHRYTRNMLTNSQKIKPTEEVQVVIHMDGWGGKQHKISTHKLYIYPEPVQFTGFKIFYKNDIKEKGTTIYSPSELLSKLSPLPSYIQYQ